jgi:hypothetical protein
MRRLVILLVLLTPAVLAAQEQRFELTPTLGYVWGGSIQIDDQAFTHQAYDVDLGDSGSFALVFGVPIAQRTWFELVYRRQDTALVDNQGLFGEEPAGFIPPGSSKELDTDVTYYHVGAQWELTTGPSRWFLTASAGVANFDFSLPMPDSTRLSVSGGGGLKLDLNDRIGLRFGAKAYWTDTDEGSARVQRFEHRDCSATCYYVYSYKPDFFQTELSLGLIIRL